MLSAIIDLKLHLGLKADVIAALTLGDVKKQSFLDFPVLCIAKKMGSSGQSVPVPLASTSQNRVVSLPDAGESFHLYCANVMGTALASGEEKEVYESWPLFSLTGDPQTHLTAEEIRSITKPAKDALKIEELIFKVPQGRELSTQDLNKYRGDIFRAFYVLRLRHTVLHTDDMAYLYGTKTVTVACTNYRDYLHPGSQIILHQLQNRCANMQAIETAPLNTEKHAFQLTRGFHKHISIDAPNTRTETVLSIDVPPQDKLKELKISVNCQYGMDFSATYDPNFGSPY